MLFWYMPLGIWFSSVLTRVICAAERGREGAGLINTQQEGSGAVVKEAEGDDAVTHR